MIQLRLNAEQRRASILDAALTRFAAESYDRISLNDLAAATGVSKPVLYDHFASKDALYTALLEREGGLLLAALGASFAPDQPLDARLRGLAEAMLSFVRRRPEAARLLQRTPDGGEAARAAHERFRATMHRFGAAAILADPVFAARPGLSRRASAELLATLHGAVLEGIAAWALEHPSASARALGQVFVDVLWTGLR
jgi:AcrR family transcriptional regulator